MKYTSKGKTITKSSHHTGMYIVSFTDGGWYNLVTTDAQMLRSNPPDDPHLFTAQILYGCTVPNTLQRTEGKKFLHAINGGAGVQELTQMFPAIQPFRLTKVLQLWTKQ